MSRLPTKSTVVAAAMALGAALFLVNSLPAAASGEPHARNPQVHVVNPGESIQEAVDAARRGDKVVVTAGTYAQTVVLQKNRLTLRARGDVTLTPPAVAPQGICDSDEEVVGICVVPADLNPDDFTYTSRVRGVTVNGFELRGFGDGVLGFGTRNLHVRRVLAVDNGGYGVASFDGIGSRISWNRARGSDVAGIYVGDSPQADALVKHNRTRNNQFGFFVRHTHDVTLRNNRTWNNCIGALLLDDGQPEGSRENLVLDNRVLRNNRVCVDDEDGTTFSGAGIVLLGSRHNRIAHNTVRGNNAASDFSGGVVLLAQANRNRVAHNFLRNNEPVDIRKDQSSVRNRFVANNCESSQPPRICS
jgi:nitrous oxidase accessory protein NosD